MVQAKTAARRTHYNTSSNRCLEQTTPIHWPSTDNAERNDSVRFTTTWRQVKTCTSRSFSVNYYVYIYKACPESKYGNTAVDLDPLPVSRARLTVVEPALFEWDVFEMAAPIQSPTKCEVRSVIRFLNAKGERLISWLHCDWRWNISTCFFA
jgi:hypothetical protein